MEKMLVIRTVKCISDNLFPKDTSFAPKLTGVVVLWVRKLLLTMVTFISKNAIVQETYLQRIVVVLVVLIQATQGAKCMS